MDSSASIDRRADVAAMRLAIRCRRVVQACLREEEWRDADREFYQIIREGLREFVSAYQGQPGGVTREEQGGGTWARD